MRPTDPRLRTLALHHEVRRQGSEFSHRAQGCTIETVLRTSQLPEGTRRLYLGQHSCGIIWESESPQRLGLPLKINC